MTPPPGPDSTDPPPLLDYDWARVMCAERVVVLVAGSNFVGRAQRFWEPGSYVPGDRATPPSTSPVTEGCVEFEDGNILLARDSEQWVRLDDLGVEYYEEAKTITAETVKALLAGAARRGVTRHIAACLVRTFFLRAAGIASEFDQLQEDEQVPHP